MKRIAIVGGGIAGLSAGYELARQQQAGAPIEFTVFEASHRLGGIIETERRDGFTLELGPDSWVTEKPWARKLAVELGLEAELISSLDGHRKTYLAEGGTLLSLPEGMRMMVPADLSSVLASPLFSPEAKLQYQREPQRAEELKAAALDATPGDESVRDFVLRHFGAEVADTIAAPLLAGVLGGDIAQLSARAVLPTFVALEREHGSLIVGLHRQERQAPAAPIFTSLRNGLGSLIEGMESRIHSADIRLHHHVQSIEMQSAGWNVCTRNEQAREASEKFDALVLATPAKATAQLLSAQHPTMARLLPQRSSSAIVVALAFSSRQAQALHIPEGFGFLVPQRGNGMPNGLHELAQRALLACTFVDQKFSHRAPAGAVLLRAFFGGNAAPTLLPEDDKTLGSLACTTLANILGALPEPWFTEVRRWPDSLPLYTVDHLERTTELQKLAAGLPHLHLIGNAYWGVGLPDLIRDARNTARKLVAALAGPA